MSLNWIAIGAATLAAFVLGAIWYSPALFGKSWAAEVGLSPEQLKARHGPLTFILAFILTLLAAICFAFFLGQSPKLDFALMAGFTAGLFWVAGSFGINYLFEGKSLRLWAINGGYHTLQFTIYGAALSLLG